MTTFLLVCVVLLTLAVCANAALTAAMIRRLKDLSGRLPAERTHHHIAGEGLQPRQRSRAGMAPAGSAATPVDELDAPATTLTPGAKVELPDGGDDLSRRAARVLDGEWLVAFTMPDCEGCRIERPVLESVVADRARRGQNTAIVVHAEAEEAQSYQDLAAHALFLPDDPAEATLISAFGVSAFPAYLQLREGRLVRSGWSLAEIGATGGQVVPHA